MLNALLDTGKAYFYSHDSTRVLKTENINMKGRGRMSKRLKLTDILVTIVIALVFGIIYKIWGPVYDLVKLTGFQLEQITYGMWFIASIVAYLLIRKAGVAVLAELAAANMEFLFGGEWGVATLVYGLLQGLGAELVFMAFRYKRFDILVASLAGISATVASLAVDWYYAYLTGLSAWNLTLYLSFRFIGSILICGVFAYYLVKALEATGVTNLLRPASKEDYDALDD
jgi:energy-coupling factor transport system permease protein